MFSTCLQVSTEDSTVLGETIANNTVPPSAGDPGLMGGSILRLVGLLPAVLAKHMDEVLAKQERRDFTVNLVTAASALVESVTGWREIPEESGRFGTTSQVLIAIDSLGYIFGSAVREAKDNCDEEGKTMFPSDNVKLMVSSLPGGSNSSQCSKLKGLGSVCLPPPPSLGLPSGCLVRVTTALSLPEGGAPMFPPGMQGLQFGTPGLGGNIVGLTIENNNVTINVEEGAEPITVTIRHGEVEVRQQQ
jgi:hypothetical protein